ncbi:hypothetical protein KTJ34_01815 [Acinetobacter courvalinii]|uniref:phage baseplate protein n=1 Tax=Acinetobacter courvalinii TaxID=280147 RepID=UPI0021D11916|nr:hypothetical protein [Acinetobacter courvalinii]MCU4576149.1 hypothetical protein [Acinetobacter courvalinii]
MPLAQPELNAVPFAQSGLKNTIPVSPVAGSGAASMTSGFPAVTMQPIAAGGIPPSGQDFNGIFNQLSQHQVWVNAGGLYKFDQAFCTAIGGYSKGAVIQLDDGLSSYISTVNGNTNNPNNELTGWSPYGGKVVNDKLNSIVDVIYPVGIVLSFGINFDPNVHFPGTTWVLHGEGRASVGLSTHAGDADWKKGVGNIFGSDTHVLTLNEMPSHNHNNGEWDAILVRSGEKTYTDGDRNEGEPNLSWAKPMSNAGGDQAHNNVQPSIVEARWRRTV